MRHLTPTVLLALLGAACNKPPGSPTISIEPEAPSTLDDLVAVISADAVDPNEDSVTYRFAWAVDGAPVADLTTDTVPADRTTKGELWSVQVFPADDKEEGLPAAAEVEVRNSPPRVTVQVAPGSPATDDDLVATPSFEDDDGDEVALTWSWTVNGRDASIAADTVPAERTERDEVWEVTVLPNDGEVDGEPATAEVSVANSAPKVVSAQLSPADIYDRKDGATSVVDVEWEGSDIDDDELSATVTWFVDGAEVAGNGDGTLDGRAFAKGQAIRAEVIVSDGTLDSAPLLTDPVLVLNSRPSITGVALSPTALFESTTASALITGWNDEDADPEGYRYRWLVNGRDVGTDPTLTGAAWKKGDRVAVEVTPFDGEEAGTPVSSTQITVQNTLPTLASVTLSPDPVRTDDTLTATAGATADDDGDTVSVTFAWTVNGTASGTGATLAGTAFKKGDTVEVTATPNDGTGSGTAVKASLRVSNTAPVVTGLTLSPTTVRTDDTIGATATVTDADADPVTTTIRWSVNGTVVSTGTSLAGTFFKKNDKVDASAVASDGTDSSAARVASVTIANTAPTTPGIAFSPSAPSDTDNIQCTIATASTDADGDTLTYAYTWTRNGSSFTGTTTTTRTGDTVPASATSGGDTFVCNVTASDGTATSAAATRSVTVTGAVGSGQVRNVAGTWLDVTYERCGTGTSCNATNARTACSNVGKKVVSHASNGSTTVHSLGATASCQWSTSYFTSAGTMPAGSCLVGVSNLDWSGCCTTSEWHGNTLNFASSGTVFGHVNTSNSGYVSSYANTSGTTWGCQPLASGASSISGCTQMYVACTK